ncbi:myelin-associated glycoprotein-like isoform X5 [Anguilla anguilla]|uniref:myelin-associated glycoprotein-like isoform X5 n=1 Tax=Anguilla anguilla TaxID=7936 RepID=UPI0015A98FCF|nr:myelin-associated glycoprotein-like isoform X5 [Anguilla anguilla]
MRTQALWFYAIYSNVLNVYTASWTAEIPQTISALLGSCVVVPCKFNYPDPPKKPPAMTGIWHMTNYQPIYHPDSSTVMEEFRGRANLIGDLTGKNCSLRVNHLKKKDNGPFIFRIEICDFDMYSYTDNMVSIDVQDYPASPRLTVSGEVKAGDAVTASCSVSHSCPTELPHLIWSRSGTTTNQSEELPNRQWKETSNLTFTATNSDHNQHLICIAKYQQVTSVQSSKILNVTYAPVRVEVEPESTVVKEGDAVEMQCSSDSNPPAHGYQWYNITGTLLSEERIYKLHNVSRHTKALYCAAINTEGHKNSTLAKISVEYPPSIGAESGCVAEITGVNCRCLVESRPASRVQWKLADGKTENSSSVHSTDGQDSATVHTLHFHLGLTDVVSCYASNRHGHETRVLETNQRGVLMAIYLSGAAASAFVLILVILLLWKCSRRKKRVEVKINPVYSTAGLDDQHVGTQENIAPAKSHSRGKGPVEDPSATGDDNIYVNSETPYFEEEEEEEEEDYENCFKEDVYANM